jgi:sorbitol-specific phosphotransferase system component IIC
MVALARTLSDERVKGAAKLAIANAVMTLGMAPMVAWFALLAASLDQLRTGDLGLPELMFAGVAGMTAYLFTLLVAGTGAIWAAVLLRRESAGARRTAKALVALASAILLLPWMGVLFLVVARMFG